MNEYLMETKQVTKAYGRVLALDHVDLHVRRGSIYGLIGDNGAGKSTLLKLLAGQAFATSGELCLFGQHTKKGLSQSRRRIGAMVEQPGLAAGMTSRQLLEYYRIQKGIAGRTKTEEMLRLTGIWEKKDSRCKSLSMGQRQRLGLAVALLGEPELLLLDEPINGLDPSGIAWIRTLLKRLNQEKNITILLSSHILTELEQTAMEFGFLDHGKLLEEISQKDLAEKCADCLWIEVSEPEKYAALLTKAFPGEIYQVMADGTFQIRRPQREAEAYSRLAMEHGLNVRRLETQHGSLEEFYMNLKKGGAKTC